MFDGRHNHVRTGDWSQGTDKNNYYRHHVHRVSSTNHRLLLKDMPTSLPLVIKNLGEVSLHVHTPDPIKLPMPVPIERSLHELVKVLFLDNFSW